MIDDGEQTEYEAACGHLFMYMLTPFAQQFQRLMIVVTRVDDDEVTVSLEGDGTHRHVLYRQRGDEAERKCNACVEFLKKAIAEA